MSTKERLFVIFSFVFWWTKCQSKNWTNYKINKTFRQSTVSSEVKILLFDCLLYDCKLFLVVILYLLRHWSWNAFVLLGSFLIFDQKLTGKGVPVWMSWCSVYIFQKSLLARGGRVFRSWDTSSTVLGNYPHINVNE